MPGVDFINPLTLYAGTKKALMLNAKLSCSMPSSYALCQALTLYDKLFPSKRVCKNLAKSVNGFMKLTPGCFVNKIEH